MNSKTISVLIITMSLLLFSSFSFGEDRSPDPSIQHGVSFKSDSAVLLESSDQALDSLLAEGSLQDSRLKVVGYGSSRPIVDNSTSRGRESNRPIEIVRVENQAPSAVLPAPSYKFEPVPDVVEVRHDFVLQNKGNAPLIIRRVQTD